MKGKFILDSAALFNINVIEPVLAYTTQENVDEVLLEHERSLILRYLREGRLLLMEPDEENYKLALKAAEPGLSSVDLKILALAIQINKRDHVPVVTDDYKLQNALSRLNIPFLPLKTRGIKRTYRIIYRCEWCGSYFNEKVNECPKCGGPVKPVRVLIKRKSKEHAQG